MNRIQNIEKEILPLRNQLTDHRLYDLLSEIDDVKIFMEKHVYAVWDFMSLLKSLQLHLTGTTLPWKPAKNAKIARFINEIVWGEESDINEHKIPKSHYEMYLEAMHEVNADTSKVSHFIDTLDDLANIITQISNSDLKMAEKEFLKFTFTIIQSNEVHKIASAFTFGREDLIPDMFIEIINKSNHGARNKFPKLTYYLERHIEIDGDEHGPLSLEMISELCGDSDQKWNEVLEVAQVALTQRIQLWDEIANEIQAKKMVADMA